MRTHNGRLLQLSMRVSALAVAAGTIAPAAGHAQVADAQVEFSIPSGPLGAALSRFGEQSGMSIVYSADLAEGHATGGLSGRHAVMDGLQRLLAGTGLRASASGSRTIVIEAAPAAAGGERMLGSVRVQGALSAGGGYAPPTRGEGIAQLGGVRGRQDDEAAGYRARVATAGGGVPTAIEDIPRSISVLTQEQIEAQDVFDFREAMKRLPGVTFRETTSQQSGSAAIYSRGYPIDTVQIDGGAAQTLDLFGNGTLDLSAYERVELVRGPNGVFAGSNIGAGGTLNLVRKRPSDIEELDLTLTAGSFERWQGQVDYSTPSLLGSSIAFRGVLNAQDTEFFYWNADKRNVQAYGIFDFPLGESARMEVGARYSRVRENATYFGIGRYVEGPAWDVPYEFNGASDLTYNNGHDRELFARIHMDLADQWDLQFGVSRNWGFYDKAFVSSWFSGDPSLVQATGQTVAATLGETLIPGYGMRADQSTLGGLQIDARANGTFSTGIFDHAIFIGLDYSEGYTVSGEEKALRAVKPILSLADYFPDKPFISLNQYFALTGQPSMPGFDSIFYSGKDRNYASSNVSLGVVLQDVISYKDIIDLNLQLRSFSNSAASAGFNIDQITGERNWPSYNSSKSVSEIRPTYGIVIKPAKSLRLFASYSEGFSDQSNLFDMEGKPLDPSTYENWEGGVKYAASGWSAALTGYNLNRSNTAESVPENVPGWNSCPPTGSWPCFYRTGRSERSRGIDFEVNGEIVPGLQIIASYNYNENKVLISNDPISTVSPANAAKLWIDWTPSFLPQLSLRGGADYRSRIYVLGNRTLYSRDPATGQYVPGPRIQFEIDEPAATVFEFGASYDITDRISLDLLVENLFDKRYFVTQYALATPRAVTATLRFKTGSGRMRETSGDLTLFGRAADWYTGVQAGIHFASDLELDGGALPGGEQLAWTADAKGKAAIFLGLGYRFAPNWRGELEIGFRKTNLGSVGGGASAPTDVCFTDSWGNPAEPQCGDAGGDADSTSFMANLLHDFGGPDSKLRPFVGVGAGVASLSVDFGGRLRGLADDPTFGSETQTANFAYQALAGLGWRISDRLTLDAAYRHFAVSKLSLNGFVLPEHEAALGTLTTRYKSSAVTAGFRWAFGASSN